MKADLVLLNGTVLTVDAIFSVQQAVAIRKGRIIAVGSDHDIQPLISPDTKIIDLKGMTALPGINDSHMHGPFFGATRPPLAIDLTYPKVKSISDMVALLEEQVAKTPRGEWIRGYGWDQGALAECKDDLSRLPRKQDIDRVSPDHPVVFTDFSAHTLLANSKAMELAGVNRDTPDPATGELERDPKTGELTGIFIELEAQGLVSKAVPLLSKEEKKQAIRTTLQHLSANGITSFTDAAIGPGGDGYIYGVMSAEFIELYREMFLDGELSARVNVLLLLGKYGSLTPEELESNFDDLTIPDDIDHDWLKYSGIKIFADGIPPTKTSWLIEEYVGGGYGSSVLPGETEEEQRGNLTKMICYAHKKGFQVGVHATGDRAIEATVDGFEQAIREIPNADLRHYVIHGSLISPDSVQRLAKAGCGISMQPQIKAMMADFEPSLVGKHRADYLWPTRTLLTAGVPLSFSSDAPVTYPNWRAGIQAAVLREGASGKVGGSDERITVEQAIRAYTINGAWQDNMDARKGSIEVGKFADICVISADITRLDPHLIGDVAVVMTIVNGKLVYNSEAAG